jgi:hypothetical protein
MEDDRECALRLAHEAESKHPDGTAQAVILRAQLYLGFLRATPPAAVDKTATVSPRAMETST